MMNSIPSANAIGLQHATAQQLEQAAAENHTQLFCLNAVATGGEVKNIDGLIYTYGPGGDAAICFAPLTEANASATLDTMMDFYRLHPPKSAGYWSLDPPQPADLDARLLARGFQTGWRPRWMALDLQAIKTGHAIPPGLEVREANGTLVGDIKNLPYGGENGAVSAALIQDYPERAKRFIALLDGRVVGHCCLFFSTGDHGIAGMYNVGVLPNMQRRGIGKAVVVAACQYAATLGYGYTMLNANDVGIRTYEEVGFQYISHGFTWWLMGERFKANPPSPKQVLLAEAVGRGDIATLDNIREQFTPDELNKPLSNEMTLMQLAAHCKQPAAAEWLVTQGIRYTALAAWDLGWKERAAALLANDPQEVDRRYYEWQGSLLHVAAERDDLALCELALAADPDLSIKDKFHFSTAMGWAQFFKRAEMIALINKYTEDSNPAEE
jgi:GNAT superfamily N-acetyltransferase